MGTQSGAVKPEDIFNYAKAAGQKIAATNQRAVDVASLMQEQASSYSDMIQTNRAAGNARQGVLAAEDAITKSLDAQKSGIVETLGMDWTNQGSQAVIWARELQANTEHAYAALDKVNESKSKSLMNDPIGFIMAQFTLPSETAIYNGFAEKAQIAEGRLNEVINATDAAAVAASRVSKQTSTELALAKSQEAAAQFQAQEQKIRLESAGTRIRGIEALNSLDAQQLSAVFQVHSAQNADAHLRLAQEQAAFMREQKARIAAELADKNADIKAYMESYNIGAKRIGRAPIGDIVTFRRLLGANAAGSDFMNVIAAGQQMQSSGGSTSGIPVAQSAGHAAILYNSGGANLTSNPVGQFLVNQFEAFKLDPTAPKDKEAFLAHVTQAAVANANKDMGTIRDDKPNIYDAPPVGVMVQSKAISTDKFFANAIMPMYSKDPNVKLSNATIVGAAAEMAKSKEDYNTAVSGLVNYYKSAVLVNNLTKEFRENGLPPQNSFNAVIGGRTYNLTKVEDVRRVMLMSGRSGSHFVF